MARDADIIEETVQLGDDIIDLRGQVACIDGHPAPG